MSAIGLDSRSYLEVLLNGVSLPLEAMNFGGIVVSEHQLYHLPCGQMTFSDRHKIMNEKFTLADGNPLVIRIGPNADRVETYKFRVFHANVKQDGPVLNYTVSFIADYPGWFMKSGGASIQGTTSAALKAIAARNGLDFYGVETADSQVWLPITESECRFARRIASFGYVDSSSCMLMGVTLKGQLRYSNLNSINFQKELPNYVHGAEKGIFCTSWSGRSLSGIKNVLGGYAAATSQYDPEKGLVEATRKVQTKRITKSVNVNKDLQGKVGDGRNVIMPVDSGNKHSKAVEARSQNFRIAMFLAQSVSVITPVQTKENLFDPVYFSNYLLDQKSQQGVPDPNTSGPYMVAGKALYIGPDLTYVERLQFVRDGYGTDKSGVTQ